MPRRLVAALLAAGGFAAGWSLGSAVLEATARRWDGALTLQRVQVAGCRRLDPAQLVAAAGLQAPLRWTALDRGALVEKLQAHPWVARARLTALPPGTLLVGVEERRPVAVSSGPQGAAVLLDASGRAFAPAADEDVDALPRLVDDASPELRARGVGIARALAERRHLPAAREIVLGPPEAWGRPTLRLAGLTAPVVLGPGLLADKLGRLERLLAADVEELADAERIDLRFAERAILKVSPPRTGAAQRREGADAASRPNRDPAGSGGPETRG